MKVNLTNLGTVNKNKVSIETERGSITLYFSYETVVGFVGSNGLRVIQNLWSTTTGKLLNELQPAKEKRLDETQFQRELNEALGKI